MRLIDADSLLVKFTNAIQDSNKSRGVKYILSLPLSEALEIVLNQAETVDPVKHGEWVYGGSSENIRVTCSECGYKVNYFWNSWRDAKYCPKCGARMDGDSK